MSILCDFDFYGYQVNAEVKVGTLSIINVPDKKYRFSVRAFNKAIELPISTSYEIDYAHGVDPVEAAYAHLKNCGDFKNIQDK